MEMTVGKQFFYSLKLALSSNVIVLPAFVGVSLKINRKYKHLEPASFKATWKFHSILFLFIYLFIYFVLILYFIYLLIYLSIYLFHNFLSEFC